MDKPVQLTPEQYEAQPWLHVYGQAGPHSEVRLVGTVAGLTAMRDAISAALSDGSGEGEGVDKSGEGYRIKVERTNRTGLSYAALPYWRDW